MDKKQGSDARETRHNLTVDLFRRYLDEKAVKILDLYPDHSPEFEETWKFVNEFEKSCIAHRLHRLAALSADNPAVSLIDMLIEGIPDVHHRELTPLSDGYSLDRYRFRLDGAYVGITRAQVPTGGPGEMYYSIAWSDDPMED